MQPDTNTLMYRPFMNRDRVLYVCYPDVQEAEAICRAFADQGFKASRAPDLETLGRLIDLRRPDVILLDLELSPPDIVSTLRELAFGTRVFMLAEASPTAASVVRAVRNGALSVFTRPFRLAEMIQTIVDELKSDLRPGRDQAAPAVVQGISSLSPREREILRRIVKGETNKEAAKSLGISPRTVEVHRASIIRKLGARNTAEMIRIALQQ